MDFVAKTKSYPDGLVIQFSEVRPFSERTSVSLPKDPFSESSHQDHSKQDARRAYTKAYDYLRCNEFEWFVTLTIDPSKFDAFDISVAKSLLSQYLKHLRYISHGSAIYFFVYELTKKGRYHFHGLVGGVPSSEFVVSMDSSSNPRLDEKGRLVYNAVGWLGGKISCCTRIDSLSRAASYVCKYVLKDLDSGRQKGDKRYWASRNLKLPEVSTTVVTHEEMLATLNMASSVKLYKNEQFGDQYFVYFDDEKTP